MERHSEDANRDRETDNARQGPGLPNEDNATALRPPGPTMTPTRMRKRTLGIFSLSS